MCHPDRIQRSGCRQLACTQNGRPWPIIIIDTCDFPETGQPTTRGHARVQEATGLAPRSPVSRRAPRRPSRSGWGGSVPHSSDSRGCERPEAPGATTSPAGDSSTCSEQPLPDRRVHRVVLGLVAEAPWPCHSSPTRGGRAVTKSRRYERLASDGVGASSSIGWAGSRPSRSPIWSVQEVPLATTWSASAARSCPPRFSPTSIERS